MPASSLQAFSLNLIIIQAEEVWPRQWKSNWYMKSLLDIPLIGSISLFCSRDADFLPGTRAWIQMGIWTNPAHPWQVDLPIYKQESCVSTNEKFMATFWMGSIRTNNHASETKLEGERIEKCNYCCHWPVWNGQNTSSSCCCCCSIKTFWQIFFGFP